MNVRLAYLRKPAGAATQTARKKAKKGEIELDLKAPRGKLTIFKFARVAQR